MKARLCEPICKQVNKFRCAVRENALLHAQRPAGHVGTPSFAPGRHGLQGPGACGRSKRSTRTTTQPSFWRRRAQNSRHFRSDLGAPVHRPLLPATTSASARRHSGATAERLHDRLARTSQTSPRHCVQRGPCKLLAPNLKHRSLTDLAEKAKRLHDVVCARSVAKALRRQRT